MNQHDLKDIRDRVLARIARDHYAGADPFDGLESLLFQASGLGRFRLARLCWLQAVKRGPRVLRALAMIPPSVNPKTLALLNGAVNGVRLQDFRDQLLTLQNPDGGWGYPFEWQARAFHAMRGQSNAIVTSFVVDALTAGGMGREHPALIQAADFIENRLWRDGYFAYFEHDSAEIHNASLWAAFALNSVRPQNSKSELAVSRMIAAQRTDGGWAYGTRHHHAFIDGFHTGYILDLLDRFRMAGMTGLGDVIARGWEFYRAQCFDDQGIPRSFAGKSSYLDAHAVAQAMASLCRFGDVDGANHVANWACKNLFDPSRDLFFAGIGRFGKDQQNYMRWTQAWMVWGLSIVIEKMSMKESNQITFDPRSPLAFAHPDLDRVAKEAALRALDDDAFRALYAITRAAATQAKVAGEMEVLYGLTRGMKTLQRLAGDRGIRLAKVLQH